MGKHDDKDKDKYKVEYYCEGKDDDKHEHHHKHDKDHKKKTPSKSCSVESVRVFGTTTTDTVYPKTIKVPVTLAEISVVVAVEANIQLEKPALEIIRVWKSAILQQCELVPTFNPYAAKLFVKGFIRKNIEYTTVDQTSASSVCGDIRHMTAMIPFDFVQILHFHKLDHLYSFLQTSHHPESCSIKVGMDLCLTKGYSVTGKFTMRSHIASWSIQNSLSWISVTI